MEAHLHNLLYSNSSRVETPVAPGHFDQHTGSVTFQICTRTAADTMVPLAMLTISTVTVTVPTTVINREGYRKR